MSDVAKIILISISSSGILVWILKLILERSLTLKFKNLEQEHVARLTEQFRIKAKVFDERYTAYREISRQIVMALERGKSMVIFATEGWLRDFYFCAASMSQIQNSLAGLMAEHRMVIEPEIKELCSAAIDAIKSLACMYSPDEEQMPDYAKIHNDVLDQIKECVQELERVDSSLEVFGWSRTK